MTQPNYQKAIRRTTLRPLDKSDRISTLNEMLDATSSFCLYAPKRYGTTTLMRDYTSRTNGSYVNCVSNWDETRLNQEAGNGNVPVMFDEVTSLFFNLGDQRTMGYFSHLAKNRRVGLRVHNHKKVLDQKPYLKELIQESGFKIIEIGKHPWDELQTIYQNIVKGTGVEIPEELLRIASQSDDRIIYQTMFIRECIKFMSEGVSKNDLDPEVIRLRLKRGYFCFEDLK